MTTSELVGSEWESKDGTRGLVVLSEEPAWCGERQFMVKGTVGSTRRRVIGYRGLLAKYRRLDDPPPTVEALQARVAELEAFVTDLAGHGLRFDLNPTMQMGDVGQLYVGFANYLVRADESIRQRAAELLPEES
ncbi:hypothetical protein [Nocardia ignorata]|uniref:Uncharacterized protein n=1 Tax=Nocardia ignorata TaxID=145285 RepID=A0A4R6NZR6_NOCIG|nr:hypothetical protein [Nocardia ignorata]TDP29797.1 hypothetical protein DFR75_11265 [Nocardia ignorata]